MPIKISKSKKNLNILFQILFKLILYKLNLFIFIIYFMQKQFIAKKSQLF